MRERSLPLQLYDFSVASLVNMVHRMVDVGLSSVKRVIRVSVSSNLEQGTSFTSAADHIFPNSPEYDWQDW